MKLPYTIREGNIFLTAPEGWLRCRYCNRKIALKGADATILVKSDICLSYHNGLIIRCHECKNMNHVDVENGKAEIKLIV